MSEDALEVAIQNADAMMGAAIEASDKANVASRIVEKATYQAEILKITARIRVEIAEQAQAEVARIRADRAETPRTNRRDEFQSTDEKS